MFTFLDSTRNNVTKVENYLSRRLYHLISGRNLVPNTASSTISSRLTTGSANSTGSTQQVRLALHPIKSANNGNVEFFFDSILVSFYSHFWPCVAAVRQLFYDNEYPWRSVYPIRRKGHLFRDSTFLPIYHRLIGDAFFGYIQFDNIYVLMDVYLAQFLSASTLRSFGTIAISPISGMLSGNQLDRIGTVLIPSAASAVLLKLIIDYSHANSQYYIKCALIPFRQENDVDSFVNFRNLFPSTRTIVSENLFKTDYNLVYDWFIIDKSDFESLVAAKNFFLVITFPYLYNNYGFDEKDVREGSYSVGTVIYDKDLYLNYLALLNFSDLDLTNATHKKIIYDYYNALSSLFRQSGHGISDPVEPVFANFVPTVLSSDLLNLTESKFQATSYATNLAQPETPSDAISSGHSIGVIEGNARIERETILVNQIPINSTLSANFSYLYSLTSSSIHALNSFIVGVLADTETQGLSPIFDIITLQSKLQTETESEFTSTSIIVTLDGIIYLIIALFNEQDLIVTIHTRASTDDEAIATVNILNKIATELTSQSISLNFLNLIQTIAEEAQTPTDIIAALRQILVSQAFAFSSFEFDQFYFPRPTLFSFIASSATETESNLEPLLFGSSLPTTTSIAITSPINTETNIYVLPLIETDIEEVYEDAGRLISADLSFNNLAELPLKQLLTVKADEQTQTETYSQQKQYQTIESDEITLFSSTSRLNLRQTVSTSSEQAFEIVTKSTIKLNLLNNIITIFDTRFSPLIAANLSSDLTSFSENETETKQLITLLSQNISTFEVYSFLIGEIIYLTVCTDFRCSINLINPVVAHFNYHSLSISLGSIASRLGSILTSISTTDISSATNTLLTLSTLTDTISEQRGFGEQVNFENAFFVAALTTTQARFGQVVVHLGIPTIGGRANQHITYLNPYLYF